MRLPFSFAAAAVLLSAIGAADAADPALLGATGGFLLGKPIAAASRQIVVVSAAKVIRDMI